MKYIYICIYLNHFAVQQKLTQYINYILIKKKQQQMSQLSLKKNKITR